MTHEESKKYNIEAFSFILDELDFLRQDPKVFDIIADVSNQKGDAMQVIGQILCDISHGIEDPSGKEKVSQLNDVEGRTSILAS